MNTAKAEWNNFADKIGLADKCETQQAEMQRAFYAGQFSFLMFQLNELAIMPDAKVEAGLANRKQELEDYFRSNFQKRN